jgi:hypothetical membrane protein
MLLACGAVGPPSFVAVFLVEGLLGVPGYNPLRHPVSSFALGSLGWVQIANFLVTGMLVVAFAFGLRLARRRAGGGIWAPLLIGLAGVGMIGAGVFLPDPISGYPPGTPMLAPEPTTSGAMHYLFSTPVFLGLPAACCVVAYRFATSGRSGWACYSVATGAAFLTGFVLTSNAFAQNPTLVPIGGLLQRITLTIGMAWLTALALLRLRQASDASQTSH